MRSLFSACLLTLLMLPACAYLQKPLWRPEGLTPVESAHDHAADMINQCGSRGYRGQAFASLPESRYAQCQPNGSGQECALLVVHPESRIFSFADARRYTATVQAKTWFNVVVNSAGNITQCRTETE